MRLRTICASDGNKTDQALAECLREGRVRERNRKVENMAQTLSPRLQKLESELEVLKKDKKNLHRELDR